MRAVACPKCGETERLIGIGGGKTIHVVCEACGTNWTRDTEPSCGYCGAAAGRLEYTPIPLWSAGRGTMRTPAGERASWYCKDCQQPDVTRPTPDDPAGTGDGSTPAG